MLNFGTWQAHGLRVLWLGGLANPDVLAQATDTIIENLKAYKAASDPFANAILVLTPNSESRVREYKTRPLWGKSTFIFATDNLSAARGLARFVISKYDLPVRPDSLIIPSEGV